MEKVGEIQELIKKVVGLAKDARVSSLQLEMNSVLFYLSRMLMPPLARLG